MADPIDVVTLDEAKRFLNISTTTSDIELGGFITAASQMWVRRVGPVSGAPVYDERYDGGSPRIALRQVPVAAVSLVEESYGSQVRYTLTEQTLQAGGDNSAWGYSIEYPSGLLTRRAAGVPIQFAAGQRNIHVVYTAGYTNVPADIRQAVCLLIAHMWETQRGGSKRPGQGGQDDWQPREAYAWPNRVEEIAMGYRIMGIA